MQLPSTLQFASFFISMFDFRRFFLERIKHLHAVEVVNEFFNYFFILFHEWMKTFSFPSTCTHSWWMQIEIWNLIKTVSAKSHMWWKKNWSEKKKKNSLRIVNSRNPNVELKEEKCFNNTKNRQPSANYFSSNVQLLFLQQGISMANEELFYSSYHLSSLFVCVQKWLIILVLQ